MKRIILILGIVLIFLLPVSASGQDKKNYIAVKTGVYTFLGGLEEANFSTGFNGEMVYGFYLHPNFALEAGTGYFHDGVNKGYGNNVKGIPITLTAKGIYPFRSAEFFAGGGTGVYFAKFHGQVNDIVADKRDTVFGGHLVIGANYNILPVIFLGIEGKYIVIDKAEFNVFSPHLSGYTITSNFGFRF
jgi:hypothetical protein